MNGISRRVRNAIDRDGRDGMAANGGDSPGATVTGNGTSEK